MKRILFVFALVSFAAFAAQAQSCCSKGTAKSASAGKSEAACTNDAIKAASMDDSIEQRTDANTGKVTFVRRTVDASTGEANYAPVEYCTETKKFINKSSEKSAACCTDSKGSKAGCCSKPGSAKASSTSVKLSKSGR
jgi:hypothetical protein